MDAVADVVAADVVVFWWRRRWRLFTAIWRRWW
jgi:hypothetical protein